MKSLAGRRRHRHAHRRAVGLPGQHQHDHARARRAEEVMAMDWLHPHYATPDGRQRMNFQGFVVQAPGRVIVVDSCIGAGRQRDFDVFCDLPEGFLEDLESLGIEPARRRYGDVHPPALRPRRLEHLQGPGNRRLPADLPQRPLPVRPDRVRGVAERRSATTAYHTDTHLRRMRRPDRRARAWPTSSRPITRSATATGASGASRSHGHTPGHVHVRISSNGEEAVITGDLMHHPMQVAMPHRQATFDMDKEAGRQTRMGFVEKYADSGVHGDRRALRRADRRAHPHLRRG